MKIQKAILQKLTRKVDAITYDLNLLQICHEYANFEKDDQIRSSLNRDFYKISKRLERKLK